MSNNHKRKVLANRSPRLKLQNLTCETSLDVHTFPYEPCANSNPSLQPSRHAVALRSSPIASWRRSSYLRRPPKEGDLRAKLTISRMDEAMGRTPLCQRASRRARKSANRLSSPENNFVSSFTLEISRTLVKILPWLCPRRTLGQTQLNVGQHELRHLIPLPVSALEHIQRPRIPW